MTDHSLDIPAFLRRERTEEAPPSRTDDPWTLQKRQARKIGQECHRLLERDRKRRARAAKKRRCLQTKGGAA